MSLQSYIDRFRTALEKLSDFGLSESFDFKQEIRSGKQAIITARVILLNETILHVKIYLDARYKVDVLSYAFQYQKKNGALIFRYDNAAHKPARQFKEHKHLRNGSVVEASMPEPSVFIDEIIEML